MMTWEATLHPLISGTEAEIRESTETEPCPSIRSNLAIIIKMLGSSKVALMVLMVWTTATFKALLQNMYPFQPESFPSYLLKADVHFQLWRNRKPSCSPGHYDSPSPNSAKRVTEQWDGGETGKTAAHTDCTGQKKTIRQPKTPAAEAPATILADAHLCNGYTDSPDQFHYLLRLAAALQ